MRKNPPLSTTAARIRPPVFADLQARIDALAGKGLELVPLQIGDTWMAPPASARRALGALDPEDPTLHRYGPTAGVGALRAAVARRVRPHGLEIDPEAEVLVGNGGTHALFCAARAVLDAGDEVLMASPYWPLAPGIFTSCGALPVDVPLTQRLFADPSLDAGAVLAAGLTPRTKAIYLISPNNPDGKVLSREQLSSIARVACEHDLWVFSDEVYADIVFAGEHVSIASLPGMRDRTIVLHSMSKSHALAGARVGFVVAPPPVVISGRRVSTHSAFNVSVAMQRAALAALEEGDFPKNACAQYREARDVTAKALAAAGGKVRAHLAEGATYLFLDFAPAFAAMDPERAGPKPLLALLERAVDRGVLLAPGDAFGATYETCARLCYTAVPAPKVALGVERLLDALDAMEKGRP
ncbi:MAG: pyridoxal phosphate-dependent aminotransferase [Deltaproteobacteria bacterium]|nr:pyridoxal phosphate-dependent aminotransferase [Deltaproteobacteria bacterium]